MRPSPVGSFVPGWAEPRDNTALQAILRATPMPGPIRLTIERAPDFFDASSVGWDRHSTAVAREPGTGEAFAMCSRSVRSFFVNGRSIRLGYLSQLRVMAGHRAHKTRLLKMGFEWMASTRQAGEAAYDFTTLVEGNGPAARLLMAGLRGLPRYAEVDRMLTFLLPVHRARVKSSKVEVRRISFDDARVMACLERFGQRHQFAPHWAPEDFARASGPRTGVGRALPIGDAFTAFRGDQLVGCVGLWDQRPQRQVVVRGYSGMLAWLRPGLNLLGAKLPAPGGVLPLAWLCALAIEDDSPVVFEALTSAAAGALRGHSDVRWLALMLADRHPLSACARRLAAHRYASRLFVVQRPETRVDLDGRITYLEGALL